MPRSLDWIDGRLRVIDQRKLPECHEHLDITTVDELLDAISGLAVRGAPALAVAGAFGVALSAVRHSATGPLDVSAVRADADRIARCRPTAVNLSRGVARAVAVLDGGADAVLAEARALLDEDERVNRAAAGHAAEYLLATTDRRPLRILTHCNTGSLATGAWGTALGAVRDLHERGLVEHVLATETRPLLQGSRLTTWELQRDGIPVRLCPDNAAASALKSGTIDCVVVGADRVAANGDVANKIGTYPLALAAARHSVPFVVVATSDTVDEATKSGDDVTIEQRDADEVTSLGGRPVAPPGTPVYNPAFDVTPHDLISAVITERGVRAPSPVSGLAEQLAAHTEVVTDFPSPGVLFQDLAGVYRRPGLLKAAARDIARRVDGGCDVVVGVEARGFVLAAAVAVEAGLPLLLARKPGKTPGKTECVSYRSEYSTDTLELSAGALSTGHRALIVDDVLATGGTLAAARAVVEACGGTVTGYAVLTEIAALEGATRLTPIPVHALHTIPEGDPA
ncbi:S-methyl-5-thioribose-1-phosphate isomerase [Streptomyces acidiscabies]|uniref:S-methyl-5-thioribose-1-phosphate isomerase n=1 Tax=Streptomyces acidiscabies TaxID=42234 RepID=UPI000951E616|nr:S-methyl-5-thioribose-1-phosphate isomerase [Streptomyces acidiscabies]